MNEGERTRNRVAQYKAEVWQQYPNAPLTRSQAQRHAIRVPTPHSPVNPRFLKKKNDQRPEHSEPEGEKMILGEIHRQFFLSTGRPEGIPEYVFRPIPNQDCPIPRNRLERQYLEFECGPQETFEYEDQEYINEEGIRVYGSRERPSREPSPIKTRPNPYNIPYPEHPHIRSRPYDSQTRTHPDPEPAHNLGDPHIPNYKYDENFPKATYDQQYPKYYPNHSEVKFKSMGVKEAAAHFSTVRPYTKAQDDSPNAFVERFNFAARVAGRVSESMKIFHFCGLVHDSQSRWREGLDPLVHSLRDFQEAFLASYNSQGMHRLIKSEFSVSSPPPLAKPQEVLQYVETWYNRLSEVSPYNFAKDALIEAIVQKFPFIKVREHLICRTMNSWTEFKTLLIEVLNFVNERSYERGPQNRNHERGGNGPSNNQRPILPPTQHYNNYYPNPRRPQNGNNYRSRNYHGRQNQQNHPSLPQNINDTPNTFQQPQAQAYQIQQGPHVYANNAPHNRPNQNRAHNTPNSQPVPTNNTQPVTNHPVQIGMQGARQGNE